MGVNLLAVAAWSEDVWLVGDANGDLWVTENQGITWTEKDLPGTSITQIDKIVFTDEAEGFIMARQTVSSVESGIILRTITGGYEWRILPDQVGAVIPANDYLNDLAVCGVGKNRVFAGGLDDGGTTGMIVKASA